MSKTVAVAEFQAHSLEWLEEVAAKQEEVVVLKDGKPLARVMPIESRRPMTLEELRSLGGEIHGDLMEPLEEWDAAK